MQNEILNQRIIRFLSSGPESFADIAAVAGGNADAREIRHALTDLMDMGKVTLATDGRRYELASGGCAPGPTGGNAA